MSTAPRATPPRAVLFDAAGTLFELRRPVGEFYSAAARRQGCDIGAWRLTDAFARILRQAPPMVFPSAPPARVAELERGWWREIVRQTFRAADAAALPADFDALFRELFELFAGERAWRLRPGAAACLDALRAARVATGVVSNFDHRLPALLRELGLSPRLDCVVRAGELGQAKPAPALFSAALARLGVAARDAVFVGDDERVDLAGARAAGLGAIAVTELATLADLPARLGVACG